MTSSWTRLSGGDQYMGSIHDLTAERIPLYDEHGDYIIAFFVCKVTPYRSSVDFPAYMFPDGAKFGTFVEDVKSKRLVREWIEPLTL